MPKYKVTNTSIRHNGTRYNRGEIVELEASHGFGQKVELYVEPVVIKPVKPKRTRKKVLDED